jgi:hypothetical protein
MESIAITPEGQLVVAVRPALYKCTACCQNKQAPEMARNPHTQHPTKFCKACTAEKMRAGWAARKAAGSVRTIRQDSNGVRTVHRDRVIFPPVELLQAFPGYAKGTVFHYNPSTKAYRHAKDKHLLSVADTKDTTWFRVKDSDVDKVMAYIKSLDGMNERDYAELLVKWGFLPPEVHHAE